MKKIAFIITKSEVGGAQTWVKDQVELFQNDLIPVIMTNKEGWLSDNSSAKNCYFVPEIESKFSIKALFKIQKILKDNRIDVVVASSANAGLYSRLSKLFYHCRVIYVSHGWSCIYNGGKFQSLFIKVEQLLSYLTESILCVSRQDAVNAKNIIGISNNKITTIRNAVFPKVIKNKSKKDILKILFVGRLAHPKRLDLLIDAVNQCKNVHLTVVGDGPERDLYQSSYKVNFLGEIKSFDDFQTYDLFALISESEGLPMSALEAASAGLPLLLSNVGGCSELIENNGLIVDNTVDHLITSIDEINTNYLYYFDNAKLKSSEFDLREHKSKYFELYFPN